MDIKLGRNNEKYARKEDEHRILIAEKKANTCTRDARIRFRQKQKDALDITAAAGSLLYGAKIDDSIFLKHENHANHFKMWNLAHQVLKIAQQSRPRNLSAAEFCDSLEQGTVWDNTYEESELSHMRNTEILNNDENKVGDQRANEPFNKDVGKHSKSIIDLKIGDIDVTQDNSRNSSTLESTVFDTHVQLTSTENATPDTNDKVSGMVCDLNITDTVGMVLYTGRLPILEHDKIPIFEDDSMEITSKALNQITIFSRIQSPTHIELNANSSLHEKESTIFLERTVEISDDLSKVQSLSQSNLNEFDRNEPNLLPEKTLIFCNKSADFSEIVSTEKPQKAVSDKPAILSNTSMEFTEIVQKPRNIEKSSNPSLDRLILHRNNILDSTKFQNMSRLDELKKLTTKMTMTLPRRSVDLTGIALNLSAIETVVVKMSTNDDGPVSRITFQDQSPELIKAVLKYPNASKSMSPNEIVPIRRLSLSEPVTEVRVNFNYDKYQQQITDISVPYNESMDITRAQTSVLQARTNECEEDSRTTIFNNNSIECTEAVSGIPLPILPPYSRENYLANCGAAINCRHMNSLMAESKTMVFRDDSMELTNAIQCPLQSIRNNRTDELVGEKYGFDDIAECETDGNSVAGFEDLMEITRPVQCSSQVKTPLVLEKENDLIEIKDLQISGTQLLHQDNRIDISQNKFIEMMRSVTSSQECEKSHINSNESSAQHYPDCFESSLQNENRKTNNRDSQSFEIDGQSIVFGSEKMEFTEPISELFSKLILSTENIEETEIEIDANDNGILDPAKPNVNIKKLAESFSVSNTAVFDQTAFLTQQAALKDAGMNLRTNLDFNSETLSVKMSKFGVNDHDSEKSICSEDSVSIGNSELPRNNWVEKQSESRSIEYEDRTLTEDHNFSLTIGRENYDISLEKLRSRTYSISKFQPEVSGSALTEGIIIACPENHLKSITMACAQAKEELSFASADTISTFEMQADSDVAKNKMPNFVNKKETFVPDILQLVESSSHIAPCMIPDNPEITLMQEINVEKRANNMKIVNMEERMHRQKIHVSQTYLEDNCFDTTDTSLPAGYDEETVEEVKNHRLSNTGLTFAAEFSNESPQSSSEELRRGEAALPTEGHSSNASILMETVESWNNRNFVRNTIARDDLKQQLIFQDANDRFVLSKKYHSDGMLSTIASNEGQTVDQLVATDMKNRATTVKTSRGISAQKRLFCIFKKTIESLSKRSNTIWNINRLDEKIVAFNFFSKSIVLVIYLTEVSELAIANPIEDIALLSQLVKDETDSAVYLAHSLIMENIDSASLTRLYRTYEEIPQLLEYVTTEVKLGMDFLFELDSLRNHNVVEIHENRITFSTRTRHINAGIILNITIQIKPFKEIDHNDITVSYLLGSNKIRERDVERLITSVKRDHRFLRVYMADVRDYIDLAAETCFSTDISHKTSNL